MSSPMLTVAETRELILSKAVRLAGERVPLDSALDRTLLEDVCADSDSPPFDCSAMDGYALREHDSSESFGIVGEVQAGSDTNPAIGVGQCVRIFTGARVPTHAERVIMQEDATVLGGVVRFAKNAAGPFIRRQGENCRAGEVMVAANSPLGPLELAVLASCGKTEPLLSRSPRFAHLVTGNELVKPSECPTGSQIRDCNSTLIQSLLTRHGGELVFQGHTGDDLAEAQAVFSKIPEHDVLLISGGASVGAYDFARPLLEWAGYQIHLQKVNLRPGKPLVFASRPDGASRPKLAFALPGNPVSHWVVFELFVAPLIARMTGSTDLPELLTGRLAGGQTFRADVRHTFWPCRANVEEGAYVLSPLKFVSSGDVMGMAGANALLSLPPRENRVGADERVEFILCK